MWDVIKRSPTAAVSAIILHVLILLFFDLRPGLGEPA